jgi:hypothetical protein
LDLAELFYFQDHPIETPAVQEKLRRFRQQMTGLALAGQVLDSMVRQKVAVLTDPSGQQYRITAKKVLLDDQGSRPRLELIEPKIEQAENTRHSRSYWAEEGSIQFQTGSEGVTVGFVLRKNVKLQDSVETPKQAVRQMSPYEAPSITIPFESIRTTVSYSDEQILDPALELPLPESLRAARMDWGAMLPDMKRKITAAVHSRLTMSSSTLVLVLLAAALGIVLRGGHALTAFGVAFVPTVIVVLVILAGRQLAETGNTSIVGLATMWGIIAVMALADAAIVFGGIRR